MVKGRQIPAEIWLPDQIRRPGQLQRPFRHWYSARTGVEWKEDVPTFREHTMSTLKTQILEVAAELPDDCTLDDFRYRLYLRLKAQEGLAAIEAGQTHTREEVQETIKSWRKSYGQPRP
jgi:hypothetical protein